jgi:hypothetical protein
LFAPYNSKGKDKASDPDKLWDYPDEKIFRAENKIDYIRPGSSKPLKYRDMTIRGLNLKPEAFTASGIA